MRTRALWTLLLLSLLALAACDAEQDTEPDGEVLASDAQGQEPEERALEPDSQGEPREGVADAQDDSLDAQAPPSDAAGPPLDDPTPDADTESGDEEDTSSESLDSAEVTEEVAEDECELNADCAPLSEGMPCHISVCEFGECLTVQKSNGSPCDDGNPCTGDDACEAGACLGVESPEADGCANVQACDEATLIDALPFEGSGTTIGESAYYDTGSCSGEAAELGEASSDVLYRFTPQASGLFTLALSELPDDPEGLDALLYVFDGCPGLTTSACLSAQDINGKRGGEEFTLSLEAGVEIFIVIDGPSNTSNVEGNFTLTLEQEESPEDDCTDGLDDDGDGLSDCEDPGCVEDPSCLLALPGALCENPITVSALPFIHAGSTEDMGNESSVQEASCPKDGDAELTLEALGGASDDVFFSFTPESEGSFLIALEAQGDGTAYADLVLSLYEGACPDDEQAPVCISGTNALGAGGELMVVELNAATSYLIVVDGWSNEFDIHGDYTLRIEALSSIPVGALAITEVMGNPEGEISDGNAEWIEIRNTTTEEHSLKGMGITYRSWSNGDEVPETPSAVFIIEEEVSIAPNASAILAKSMESGVNGGLSPLAAYGSIGMTNNGAKSIALQLVAAGWQGNGEPPEALVIDHVELPSGIFSGAGKSASFQLDEGRASNPEAAKMNDWAYRWCHTPGDGSSVYFAGNHGSPGAANGLCEGADGPPPMSFEDDIRPIFELRCLGCHTGNGCSGGGCWDDYDDLMLESYYCQGKTKGECTLVRVHDGSMPQGSGCSGDPEADALKEGCLSADEQDFIGWWIEGGMVP